MSSSPVISIIYEFSCFIYFLRRSCSTTCTILKSVVGGGSFATVSLPSSCISTHLVFFLPQQSNLYCEMISFSEFHFVFIHLNSLYSFILFFLMFLDRSGGGFLGCLFLVACSFASFFFGAGFLVPFYLQILFFQLFMVSFCSF